MKLNKYFNLKKDKRRLEAQYLTVIKHLEYFQILRVKDAINHYSITRLSSHIHKMRKEGYQILTLKGDDNLAVYVLENHRGEKKAA